MRVIIAGSRDASSAQVRLALRACPWIDRVTVVVSGTASGADEEGEYWAMERGLRIDRFPADWKAFGKSAGPIRNKEMSENADGLIAIWDGVSRGTQSMIKLAQEQGLQTFVFRLNGAAPDNVPPKGAVAERWAAGIVAPQRATPATRTFEGRRAPDSQSNSKSFRLNTLLASFSPEASVVFGWQPFHDRDQLAELRDRLRESHLVKRARNGIECIAYASGGQIVGEKGDARLVARPDVAQSLLQNWLFRSLARHGVRWSRTGTIEYVSQRPEANLLNDALVRGVRLPEGVGRRIAADFDVCRMRGPSGQYRNVIAIDVRTRITIDCTIAVLVETGMDPRGLYAIHLVETQRGPSRRLAGRILSVRDDMLVLDPQDSEVLYVPLHAAWLEPRPENLARVIAAIAGPLAGEIQERLHGLVAERLGGRARLDLVDRWVTALRGFPNDVGQGVLVRLDTAVMRADGGRFPSYDLYEQPRLVFDVGLTKTSVSNQKGLDQFGPYNFERFPNERPNIALVCEETRQGDVERFVKKLLDGVPDSQWAGRGLIRRYHLKHPGIRTFPAKSSSAKHYKEAVAAAIEDSTARNERWNLAFIQTQEASHDLHGDDNPYLVTKALFLAHQVPTQAFEWESVRPGVGIDATINNIGLATYAKLDGVPWLLPVHQTVAHELVIGIGSFETSGSRFGSRKKYIGVSTVFSASGRYFLESRTPATVESEYIPALVAALKRAIDESRRREGWTKDDMVRLVFHVFKDLNKAEIEAVRKLMAQLELPHAQFAFLHLVKDHPYMLFDPSSDGVGPRRPKGVAAAPKGLCVEIGEHEALVCLKGAGELRRWSDGTPKPMLIKVHRESTFKNLSYLARQVFDFTFLSWRTLFASSLPITVLYSNLVAENLIRLQDVSGWSPETMLGPVGRGRWFL